MSSGSEESVSQMNDIVRIETRIYVTNASNILLFETTGIKIPENAAINDQISFTIHEVLAINLCNVLIELNNLI